MTLSIRDLHSITVTILIGIMPVLMLTESGHSSNAWYILVIACLIICFTRAGGIHKTLRDLQPYQWVAAAFFFSLVPPALNMLRFQTLPGAEIERSLRLILGCLLILGAVLSLRPEWLKRAIWGFMFAGLLSCTYVFWPAEREFGRPVTPEYNSVTYGNLMLLLSMLVMYSMRWTLTPWPRAEKWVKLCVIVIVFLGFSLTQTRTGWLALPFFLMIWLLLNNFVKRPMRLIAALAVLICICATSVMLIPKMNERTKDVYREVSECLSTNPTAFTSVCIRIQLWRSSLDMFYQHPFLGIGSRSKFQPELAERVNSDMILPVIAENFGEPHSDMFMILATEGVLGGISLLLLYLVPAILFAKRLTQPQTMNIRAAAAMGLAICLGFAIFGLTELMFRGMRTVGFYAVVIGWLLALSDQRMDHNR